MKTVRIGGVIILLLCATVLLIHRFTPVIERFVGERMIPTFNLVSQLGGVVPLNSGMKRVDADYPYYYYKYEGSNRYRKDFDLMGYFLTWDYRTSVEVQDEFYASHPEWFIWKKYKIGLPEHFGKPFLLSVKCWYGWPVDGYDTIDPSIKNNFGNIKEVSSSFADSVILYLLKLSPKTGRDTIVNTSARSVIHKMDSLDVLSPALPR